MVSTLIVAVSLMGSLLGAANLSADDDIEAVAEAGFKADVADEYGPLLFVACGTDVEPGWMHCYGLADDQSTLVIQRGVVRDGEYEAGATRAIPMAEVWGQGVGVDVEDLQQRAEDLIVSVDFEIENDLPGRVENTRCETPESSEPGELFTCRFDVVTPRNVALAVDCSMRVTEDGDVAATRCEYL